MKSYAPKPTRNISKARAWYGFWLFFGVALFFLPSISQAALTSPVPVVTGSQYGNTDTLGLRPAATGTQYEQAWPEEHPENRRVVSIVSGSKNMLVAAYVNKGTSVNCNDGTPLACNKLEFRVSSNNGLSWSQALEGSTPWLPIIGPKFDYTLYVDPNLQDIWVSFTDRRISVDTGPGFGSNKWYTSSRIKKLVFSTTTQASWLTSGPEDTPNIGGAASVGITAVAVQATDTSGGRRVWGVLSDGTGIRPAYLAYTNNFVTGGTWTNVGQVGEAKKFLTTSLMSEVRMQAIPIGTNRVPLFIYADPENWFGTGGNCVQNDDSYGGGLSVLGLNGQFATSRNITLNGTNGTQHAFEPKVFPFAIDPNSVTDLSCKGFSTVGGYPLGFSAATFPTSTLTSRMVIAYVGGTDAAYASNFANKIKIKNCDVTVSSGSAATTVNCESTEVLLPNGPNHYNPSVSFDKDGKAWIVAQEAGTKKTTVFQETAPGSKNWSTLPVVYNSIVPNLVGAVDYANGLASNAAVDPEQFPLFIWSDPGKNRVAFSANAGGTTIGTSPAYASNPILGYGWASNFGWLSLNCINQPDEDCTSLFGLGIGATAHSNTTELPHLAASGIDISPTTAKTFPIGGYAWSSNAGFLSFERRDSMCDTSSGCTGGEDNDFGNPPGAAYHNATAATPNTPTAKYDTASQHVYGWGRFINLCNYDSANFRCRDKDEGWVRMRGYYTTGAPSQTGDLTATNTVALDTPCAEFTAGEVVAIGDDYSVVTNCTGSTLNLSIAVPFIAPTTVTVYDVTGKEYGLDAFWTGDHYELAGWAWSSNYGWIQFNPLIFVGFAWLETLFGNVYSGGDVKLPSPENLSNVRYNECDPDGDGTANSPCYVSTYRIEANNAISAVQSSGTGFIGSPPSSAGENINKGAGTCGSGANEVFCILQGPAAGFLNRSGVDLIPFPTVSSTTVSYRNALGKLDVGGLTNILNTSAAGYPTAVNGVKGYSGTAKLDVNRFGNIVYKTKPATYATQPEWTTNELAGWKNASWPASGDVVLPLNTTVPPTPAEASPLRSQVVHVQGNLTVDGAETTWGSVLSGNLDTGAVVQVPVSASIEFPTTVTLQAGKQASCAGCALIVDAGGEDEEYFSYTSFDSATDQFSGVKRIRSCGGSGPACPTHSAGQSVRWVWRLPYADNGTENIAQRVTVVVDGDLDIQYNIIAADRANDADLSGMVAADSIRDLPTIAFIVKGNVSIAKEVNKVTGAFIVTSRDTTKTADSTLCTNDYGNNCGGAFKTGSDNDASLCTPQSPSCRPLTIIGLLFARQLSFQRIGNLRENKTAAERVIADERLFLNPPPGLEDVTKALPNPTRTLP